MLRKAASSTLQDSSIKRSAPVFRQRHWDAEKGLAQRKGEKEDDLVRWGLGDGVKKLIRSNE